METLELLKELGMMAAAGVVEKKMELSRKLHLAYQHFQFIPQEAIAEFNKKLREKTECIVDRKTKQVVKKINPQVYQDVHFDTLTFTPLQNYVAVPPAEVLGKLKDAVRVGCFDTYEVAKIESVVEVVDPIIFGKINGCTDLFFIGEWDTDVKFEDLMKEAKNVI